MILTDLHVHTTYCDGLDTPEDMVIAAIEKDMECIGFSAHSYTFFDESYCMKKEKIENYKREINSLKEKYKGKIKILCGIEQDFYSTESISGYDYVIGSVHYLKVNGEYFPVDENAEIFVDAAKKYYGGDFYKMADDYYNTVAKIKGADIIGHIDIITKFNEGNCLFDERDERYVRSYKKVIDILLKQNIPFEINTGVVARGYKTVPYPNKDILDYIKQNGGKTILSSDAHDKDGLMFGFEKGDLYE